MDYRLRRIALTDIRSLHKFLFLFEFFLVNTWTILASFAIDCHKTKIKVIALASNNTERQKLQWAKRTVIGNKYSPCSWLFRWGFGGRRKQAAKPREEYGGMEYECERNGILVPILLAASSSFSRLTASPCTWKPAKINIVDEVDTRKRTATLTKPRLNSHTTSVLLHSLKRPRTLSRGTISFFLLFLSKLP